MEYLPKALSYMFIVVHIFGCASNYVWKHYSHNDNMQFARDKSECDYTARVIASNRMAGRRQTNYPSLGAAALGGFVEGLTEGLIQQSEFMQCMQIKGYYREKVENNATYRQADNQPTQETSAGERDADRESSSDKQTCAEKCKDMYISGKLREGIDIDECMKIFCNGS